MDFAGAPASFVKDIHPGVEYFSSEASADSRAGWGQTGTTSYGETHQPLDLWERYGKMIEI